MPKDEFDFEDPLELNGVAFLTEEDTSAEMAECFAEEFMRMGYNHKQVLALFRNPHYVGPNMVLANKGEPFVRDIIAGTFARWGKPVACAGGTPNPLTPALSPSEGESQNRPPPNREPIAAENAGGSEISDPRPLLFPLSLGGGEGQGEGDRGVEHVCTCGSGDCSSTRSEQSVAQDDKLTDPLGNPAPKLNL